MLHFDYKNIIICVPLSTENGMIEFEEFKKMYAKNAKTKEENKNDLAEAFSRFDKEGNGYISKEQLAKALGDGFDIEEMFSNADVNSDGKISYQGTYS